MRILTKIAGWPTEQYRNKLALLINLINFLERKEIISDFKFIKAVITVYPRTIYTQSLVAPVRESIYLDTNDPDTLLNLVNNIRRIFNRGNLIPRLSSIKIYTSMNILDQELVGSINIRATGPSRREYGDLDFYLYRLNGNGSYISDVFYSYMKEDEQFPDKIERLIREIFRENPEIKIFSIMDPRYSININYDKMLVISHNSPLRYALLSHISLVRRYIRYKEKSRDSTLRTIEEAILRKLGTIYNLNKVILDFASDRYINRFFRGLRKYYQSSNAIATSGSLIIVSRGSYLSDAYPNIARFLNNILSEFPDEPVYQNWIRAGLRKLESE